MKSHKKLIWKTQAKLKNTHKHFCSCCYTTVLSLLTIFSILCDNCQSEGCVPLRRQGSINDANEVCNAFQRRRHQCYFSNSKFQIAPQCYFSNCKFQIALQCDFSNSKFEIALFSSAIWNLEFVK